MKEKTSAKVAGIVLGIIGLILAVIVATQSEESACKSQGNIFENGQCIETLNDAEDEKDGVEVK